MIVGTTRGTPHPPLLTRGCRGCTGSLAQCKQFNIQTNAYLFVFLSLSLSLSISLCVYIYICICIYIDRYIFIHNYIISISIYIYIYILIYIHIHIWSRHESRGARREPPHGVVDTISVIIHVPPSLWLDPLVVPSEVDGF